MDKEYKNLIQKHTYSIPDLVIDSIDCVFEACMTNLKTLERSSIKRIVITGCGYSYAAALAIKDYLAETIQCPITVTPAIEVSRFSHECAGDYSGTLLIAISNSGEVSRLNEAVLLYKKYHAQVIALTGNLKSPIANHADFKIDISSPSIGRGLPLRGYAMTILALICIAYCLINNTERANIINNDINQLKQDMSKMSALLPYIDCKINEYLDLNPGIINFEFVGSGYERGAAFLGKIEMLGQAGVMALDEDCEQWCHCNFFLADPEKIGTVLFCSKNSPAASRSLEALSYMLHLGRPVCVVTDDIQITTPGNSLVIQHPSINKLNAGLLEMVVPSLLTGYYCDRIGETYSRGFRGQWDMFKTGKGTCESQIIIN